MRIILALFVVCFLPSCSCQVADANSPIYLEKRMEISKEMNSLVVNARLGKYGALETNILHALEASLADRTTNQDLRINIGLKEAVN